MSNRGGIDLPDGKVYRVDHCRHYYATAAQTEDEQPPVALGVATIGGFLLAVSLLPQQ